MSVFDKNRKATYDTNELDEHEQRMEQVFNIGVNDQGSVKDEAAARTQEIFSHTFREADSDQESPAFARI